jgi:hypothetical protein
MNPAMRMRVALLLLVGACASDTGATDPTALQSYDFGPYELAPGEEVTKNCVQISLHNEDYLYINSVELTTGAGFHHSNWFWVPESTFAGDDGTFACSDRNFNEPAAAIFGGVLFAQSTQAPHEVQAFPEGHVIKIPPHAKLFTQIHLLNPGDTPLAITPKIAIKPILEADVTTMLAGISFENQALALPVNMQSRFTVECDLAPRHQAIFGRAPDFNIFYALAHYHQYGTKLTVEAIKPTGESTVVYSTEHHVGDVLGGPIDPAFSMSGYTKLRMSCEFYNPTAKVIRWGVGDQEMCVFLAFSDSTYNWGGGVLSEGPPENPQMVGNMMTYTNGCTVFANDASR